MSKGEHHFSWDEHIHDDNILQAAEFLLSLESSAIQEAHRSYAYRWITALQEAFEQHYRRTYKDYWILFTEQLRPVLLEHSAHQLKQQVMRVAAIITKEMQAHLLAYLANPEIGLPCSPFQDGDDAD